MSYTLRSDKTWAQTFDDLAISFDKWGVANWDAERFYHGSRRYNLAPEERRVRVWWDDRGGNRISLELDTQDTPALNLRAIYLCIEDMRMLDVRGLSQIAQSAYLQLAGPATVRDPYEVLGVRSDSPEEVVNASARVLLAKYHPDNLETGDADKFKEVNAAWQSLKAD